LINLDDLYKIHEIRPKYYLTTSYTINKIRLELQNRIEYRIILGENSGRSIRYRPRFKVGTNFTINQFNSIHTFTMNCLLVKMGLTSIV